MISFLWSLIRRHFLSHIPLSIPKYISTFGPFRLQLQFINCNFTNFSSGHNSLFDIYIFLASKSSVIVDVGGHIGLTSLPVSPMLSSNQYLFVFEPSPTNFNLLRQHHIWSNSQNTFLFNIALGADSITSTLYSHLRLLMNTMSKAFAPPNSRPLLVDQQTLDSFEHTHFALPDLIKIDVEGAEYDVLVGMKSILAQSSPIIILSIHPVRLLQLGSSVDDLVYFLQSLGYHLFDQQHCK